MQYTIAELRNRWCCKDLEIIYNARNEQYESRLRNFNVGVNEKTCKGTKLSVPGTGNNDRRRRVTWVRGINSFTQHVQRNEYFLPTGNSELPECPGSLLLPFCKHSIYHFQNFNCFRMAIIATPEKINSPLPYIIRNRSEYLILTSLRLPP
jgi:hypothetical protein